MVESSASQEILYLYEKVNPFRMYGLAGGYTFSMPLFLGLCVIVSFVSGMFRSYKYYFMIPFYLFSIAVNARIALVSIFIVILVAFYFNFRARPYKQMLNLLIIIFIVCIMVKFVGYKSENSSTVDGWVWFDSGIKELIGLSSGELEGNMSALGDTMWFMPKGIDILLGSGEMVFASGNEDSDIGYVINLHYGGLVLSLLIYLPYVLFLLKYGSKSLNNKIMSYSVLIYVFIANAKGNAFLYNDLTKGILLLIVFSITAAYYQTSNKKEFGSVANFDRLA